MSTEKLPSFIAAKEQYREARDNERKKIQMLLSEAGWDVNTHYRSGWGDPEYTSGGVIAPYDLRNWQYVEAWWPNTDIWLFVSLQVFDRDPNSNNFHVLTDRLGIYMQQTTKAKPDVPQGAVPENTEKETINKWLKYEVLHCDMNTDVDLPLDAVKSKKLLNLIEEKRKGLQNQ